MSGNTHGAVSIVPERASEVCANFKFNLLESKNMVSWGCIGISVWERGCGSVAHSSTPANSASEYFRCTNNKRPAVPRGIFLGFGIIFHSLAYIVVYISFFENIWVYIFIYIYIYVCFMYGVCVFVSFRHYYVFMYVSWLIFATSFSFQHCISEIFLCRAPHALRLFVLVFIVLVVYPVVVLKLVLDSSSFGERQTISTEYFLRL